MGTGTSRRFSNSPYRNKNYCNNELWAPITKNDWVSDAPRVEKLSKSQSWKKRIFGKKSEKRQSGNISNEGIIAGELLGSPHLQNLIENVSCIPSPPFSGDVTDVKEEDDDLNVDTDSGEKDVPAEPQTSESVDIVSQVEQRDEVEKVLKKEEKQVDATPRAISSKVLGFSDAKDGGILYTMFVGEEVSKKLENLMKQRLLLSLQRRYQCSMIMKPQNWFYRAAMVRIVMIKGENTSNIIKYRSALPPLVKKFLITGSSLSRDVDEALDK